MTSEEFKENIIPYSRKLFPMIRRIIKDEEESRDAVQDLMLKLWKKRNELEKCDNIGAYIYSVARNYCFDMRKKKRPDTMKTEEYRILNLPSDDISHELKERHEQIHRIIDGLPDKYREVIRLRDIDGFSFEEIKGMTGLEIPYLRVILSRSRMRVKCELLKIYDYGTGTDKRYVKQVL